MLLDGGNVPVRWHPEPGSVQAPVEDLVFEGDDLAPPRRVLLHVVDALDGAPIAGFEAEIAGRRDLAGARVRAPGSAGIQDRRPGRALLARHRSGLRAREEGGANQLQNEGDDLALQVRLTKRP